MTKKQISIAMNTKTRKWTRIFTVFVAAAAFAALFFIIVSGQDSRAPRLLAALPGVLFAALFAAFNDKKFIKYGLLGVAALYTVLCVAISFRSFASGAVAFVNSVVRASNANIHQGMEYILPDVYSAAGDFLFSSTLSVWLGIGVAAVLKKCRAFLIIAYIVIVLALITLGVYPKIYAVIILGIALLGICLIDKEFSLKAAASCILVAAIIFVAMTPCFFYMGSGEIKDARNSIVSAAERAKYGEDRLPQGIIKNSYGMRSTEEVRLQITVSEQLENLYLKGFVGGEMYDNQWHATDKNNYVSNGYQGLMDFIGSYGLPFYQYARYEALCEKNDKYTVNITNVGANGKYMYEPYTVDAGSVGSPYYDLQLRASDNPNSYSFSASVRNSHSEWISQEDWLIFPEGRTVRMNEYLELEGQYRMFAYDVYRRIDSEEQIAVQNAVSYDDINSINTATQMIRRYFMDNFIYSDTPDALETDFVSDFFGGKIKKANDTYFATAATYIFRVYGYAARYVEGYYLYSETLASGGTIDVTDKNAHAWTEVYFDGIGWLPIEVTVGFFTEQSGHVFPSPDEDTETPEKPNAPDIPPDEIEKPTERPEDPVIDPNRPALEEEEDFKFALRVSLPIGLIVMAASIIILAAVLRRDHILSRKRKSLRCSGEAYGRAAYAIMEKDCRAFGGFSEKNLARYGVRKEDTRQFMEYVERSVYGCYDLYATEKHFVEDYIENTAKAILIGCGKLKFIRYKYVNCLGLFR